MKQVLPIVLIIAALGLAGCGKQENGAAPETAAPTETTAAAPETVQQAIEAIIALYEARDFDTLIRTRYAEIGKAQGEAQVQMLVDQFSRRFADDAMIARGIAAYRAAAQVTPEYSEDGTVATFPLEQGFIKFSRMENGKWGFHL